MGIKKIKKNGLLDDFELFEELLGDYLTIRRQVERKVGDTTPEKKNDTSVVSFSLKEIFDLFLSNGIVKLGEGCYKADIEIVMSKYLQIHFGKHSKSQEELKYPKPKDIANQLTVVLATSSEVFKASETLEDNMKLIDDNGLDFGHLSPPN